MVANPGNSFVVSGNLTAQVEIEMKTIFALADSRYDSV
jgi:hypothetical protein